MSAGQLGEGRREGDHDEDDEARHEDETGVHCPQDGRPAMDLPAAGPRFVDEGSGIPRGLIERRRRMYIGLGTILLIVLIIILLIWVF